MTLNLYGVYVGQTGSTGKETSIQNRRRNQVEASIGEPISLYGYMVTGGINEENVLAKMEKSIGYEPGSLNWSRSVASNKDDDNVLFQDSQGTFCNVDFNKNKYVIQSEADVVGAMGMTPGDYDVLTIDRGGLSLFEWVPTGAGDGETQSFAFKDYMDNNQWGQLGYMQSELNLNYWITGNDGSAAGNAATYAKAILQRTAAQFMSPYEMLAINNLSTLQANTAFAQLAYSRILLQ